MRIRVKEAILTLAAVLGLATLGLVGEACGFPPLFLPICVDARYAMKWADQTGIAHVMYVPRVPLIHD